MNLLKLEHVIEIYDFPASFENKDFLEAFSSFLQSGFDIKWVDSSHVLGIFSSSTKARDALRNKNPMLKVRPLAQSTRASQMKAKKYMEYLQPVKPRPRTSALAARRFVMQALGVRCPQSKHEYVAELRKERRQLESDQCNIDNNRKERREFKSDQCNRRLAGKTCRHSHSPTYALPCKHLPENSLSICSIQSQSEKDAVVKNLKEKTIRRISDSLQHKESPAGKDCPASNSPNICGSCEAHLDTCCGISPRIEQNGE
ncbi:coiled-coil domain-containing protein R3HCC1L [Xenopus laevis]|uniref:Coiled-coil domain-containing protein R3HCC1L n=2 Tax=Xenopus laevis TaxID=8355 RepID=A0A974CEN4_XENLA|nr:coiled-coil domain-containing protein R3HCC1L [Xenopus laevis]OCT71864.1 hypothetical protein XELAEV_18034840mg [Xenopus laevis]